MANQTQYRILIKGKVQGVFYRANTVNKAKELNLKGTVRNLPNGDVEIIAQGLKDNLEKLREWCWQGPEFARVDDVKLTEQPINVNYDDFTVS